MRSKHKHHIQLLGNDANNPNKIVQFFVVAIVLCHCHRMTQDVDSHSDPALHAEPTHHHRGRPPLVGFKMQLEANAEMKSRVSYFSSLLNFNSNESTHIN